MTRTTVSRLYPIGSESCLCAICTMVVSAAAYSAASSSPRFRTIPMAPLRRTNLLRRHALDAQAVPQPAPGIPRDFLGRTVASDCADNPTTLLAASHVVKFFTHARKTPFTSRSAKPYALARPSARNRTSYRFERRATSRACRACWVRRSMIGLLFTQNPYARCRRRTSARSSVGRWVVPKGTAAYSARTCNTRSLG